MIKRLISEFQKLYGKVDFTIEVAKNPYMVVVTDKKHFYSEVLTKDEYNQLKKEIDGYSPDVLLPQ